MNTKFFLYKGLRLYKGRKLLWSGRYSADTENPVTWIKIPCDVIDVGNGKLYLRQCVFTRNTNPNSMSKRIDEIIPFQAGNLAKMNVKFINRDYEYFPKAETKLLSSGKTFDYDEMKLRIGDNLLWSGEDNYNKLCGKIKWNRIRCQVVDIMGDRIYLKQTVFAETYGNSSEDKASSNAKSFKDSVVVSFSANKLKEMNVTFLRSQYLMDY